MEKESKRDKELAPKFEVAKRLVDWLNDGNRAATMEMTDEERLAAKGLFPVDVCVSPIHGAKGNVEFFLYGTRFDPGDRSQDELQSQVSVMSEKAATL